MILCYVHVELLGWVVNPMSLLGDSLNMVKFRVCHVLLVAMRVLFKAQAGRQHTCKHMRQELN